MPVVPTGFLRGTIHMGMCFPKHDRAAKVSAAEGSFFQFPFQLSGGRTFLHLKRPVAGSPGILGWKSKHGGLDIVYLQLDTKNLKIWSGHFLKNLLHVHFGLSFLLYLRLAVPARDFPGFCYPGDFAVPGILPSRGFSRPGDFVVPGILQSWGFCHPGDFPCLPRTSHAFPCLH